MDRARDVLSLRAYGASHGSHSHPHHQMLVGLDGILELEVEGRGRRVAAGDAVLVPSGDRLQRLTRARQLRNLGLPVNEVARKTGYRSPSALTAALRRSRL